MSKMDELRALREANYAQRGTAAPRRVAKAPGPAAAAPPAPSEAPAAADRLCGHKAISGRTCTREHGHAAKSHRYS